jgi:hypothetical protein
MTYSTGQYGCMIICNSYSESTGEGEGWGPQSTQGCCELAWISENGFEVCLEALAFCFRNYSLIFAFTQAWGSSRPTIAVTVSTTYSVARDLLAEHSYRIVQMVKFYKHSKNSRFTNLQF